MTDSTIDVGVLGATGAVGQEFISQLSAHPWFNLTWIAASERSAGRSYDQATTWRLPIPCPESVTKMRVDSVVPDRAPELVFSGLDSTVAGEVEEKFAKAGHWVVSNAGNHRMADDVPLLIPEVNSDHLGLLERQASVRAWAGRIVTNPNCSTMMLAMALAPLRRFGLQAVNVTTLQAVSGAGYPGVAALDMLGNVIPYIGGEEEKIETETKKILGTLRDGRVDDHPVVVSAHATRVPVINGHTEMLSVGFKTKPSENDIIQAFREFVGRPQNEHLPTAPLRPLEYLTAVDRPQPLLDVDRGKGMTVTVGRLRQCRLLDYKLVVLGHNTVRGAAGAAILNAELMYKDGLLNQTDH
jgi:aspartate-semialdehyde dehydrogenase